MSHIYTNWVGLGSRSFQFVHGCSFCRLKTDVLLYHAVEHLRSGTKNKYFGCFVEDRHEYFFERIQPFIMDAATDDVGTLNVKSIPQVQQ